MSEVTTAVTHASGFALDVPAGWEVVQDPSPEVALMALGPEVLGFRPNLVVTVGPSVEQTPQEWQPAAVEGLQERLSDLQLLDVAHHMDGFRQLLAYVQQGRALTLEQWAWRWQRADGTAQDVTLSATVPTLAYDDQADTFAAVVESWRPTGEADRGEEKRDTP